MHADFDPKEILIIIGFCIFISPLILSEIRLTTLYPDLLSRLGRIAPAEAKYFRDSFERQGIIIRAPRRTITTHRFFKMTRFLNRIQSKYPDQELQKIITTMKRTMKLWLLGISLIVIAVAVWVAHLVIISQ